MQPGPCPNCGAALGAQRSSFGKRNPVLLISLSLTLFFVIVGTVAFAAYRFFTTGFAAIPRSSEDVPPHTEWPVEHGRLASPDELRGHGRLYFVPVGRQAIAVQSLADYYHEKLGIEVTVLPQVEIRPADCVPQRRQCAAEELEAEMTAAYPGIARNPDSVMIALTDEDIFPREAAWEFTYSWHSARFGIVSTHRMDPAFWGGEPDEAVRLASTRQMLTKYVAMQYFHLPASFDPTSTMRSPLIPDGGPDNIYESDLHPEDSVNGRRGNPFPCLSFSYSYQTHQVSLDEPVLSDCQYANPAHADEEIFETDLGLGYLTERSLDLDLDSTPKIEFRRGYNSAYKRPTDFGLGWGVNHSYNSWLSSDGINSISYIDITREDGATNRFTRLDKGRGFNPNSIYESHDDGIYGARLTWNAGKYKLQYRDGASSAYLPCGNQGPRCYWVGYQDAAGNTLNFGRDASQELQHVVASDRQGIDFTYDDQHHIVTAGASNGRHISYEYDAAGCLARVKRADGQEAFYEYDSGHRMTSFSVAPRSGEPPENVLSNQYDARGRLVSQTLAGVGVFKIEYLATSDANYASRLRVTDPAGRVLGLTIGRDEYVARAAQIRFPRTGSVSPK